MAGMEILTRPFDHPDARKLDELVQAEYTVRYGSPDATPLDPAMFDPPGGIFLMAYDPAGRPVATGGWRARDLPEEAHQLGDAEIKRMFVVPEARGLGLARRMLARLEESARDAGRVRMVLETGGQQPEAVALYESSGYVLLPREGKFGYYRNTEGSRHYAKAL